jgi:hypothetical protein
MKNGFYDFKIRSAGGDQQMDHVLWMDRLTICFSSLTYDIANA